MGGTLPMFGIGFPEMALLAYAIFCISIVIYVFSLARRLVKATERIAATLERESAKPRFTG
jgi:hypothetical protein